MHRGETMSITFKAVDKFRMLRFYKDNETALISKFNAKYRVYYGESEEVFYSELTNAIKALFNRGYFIENVFETCFKYPEENRL